MNVLRDGELRVRVYSFDDHVAVQDIVEHIVEGNWEALAEGPSEDLALDAGEDGLKGRDRGLNLGLVLDRDKGRSKALA